VIMDLADTEGSVRAVTDVCIVGAGIAGLLLAEKLRRCGMHIVLLESGGRHQREETHTLNRVIQINAPYRGAMYGRARCLGGTSTLWGGALIPFLPGDFLARPYLGLPEWPVEFSAVEPYLQELETLFHVDDGPIDDEFVSQIGAARDVPCGDQDFLARFAKWPTFRRRNIATLLGDRIARDPDLQIWLNATVQSYKIRRDTGRIDAVTARDQGGKEIIVSASQFVICAGALESTRLLLWLDRSHGNAIFRDCQALGRHFFDHISTVGADIEARSVKKLNRMAGLRFVGSTMRSLRYELSPSAQRSEGVASAFGHIAFRTEGTTGFDAVRDVLRGLQKRVRVDLALAMHVAKNIPYLAKTAAWRIGRKQLYWPKPARFELHIVAEQLPYYDNRIMLGNETDMFGVPLAAIDWRVSVMEYNTIAAFARRFDEFWNRRGLGEIARLNWLFSFDSPMIDLSRGSDIFHPGGSTRMGRDSQTAVVDKNLRTFAIRNLSIASTSVFPSGASANPTFTLMMFTLRLADHLAQQHRKASPPPTSTTMKLATPNHRSTDGS
jgi:choline dehydrogenase-like flavoprotein